MEESKEAWPSLVMMESQHPRHRRRLGPARDEPPSQNRVHGWGSVCCVMRSCPARGHDNQRDRELSRIWTCKSRRCRPPQTGEPATRENIAASRRTTVATTATRLRCCHPQYPCSRVAPSALPVQVWRPRPDWRRRSSTHPLDPDLARRPWSQKCPSTTPCQSFGPRDTSPTSKIASDAAGRCPRCCDSKLTAVELGGRDGLREPQLPTPSPALATRHLLAETIESGGGAVCGHWFGDVRRQGGEGEGRRANEARPHPVPIRAARLIRPKPHRVNFWRKRDADVEHQASVLATRPDSADGGDASFSVQRAEKARRPVRTRRPDEWMWLNHRRTWLKRGVGWNPEIKVELLCARTREI